jgi:hypothetical protein
LRLEENLVGEKEWSPNNLPLFTWSGSTNYFICIGVDAGNDGLNIMLIDPSGLKGIEKVPDE